MPCHFLLSDSSIIFSVSVTVGLSIYARYTVFVFVFLFSLLTVEWYAAQTLIGRT